ncbi:hypothetical protein AYK24_03890 [Thermoplasmatales archaeon SG8-52-4]|nr:MAG: hypothetical protein AYK24_03890 [Thermoplasmatales archaeon SG8-52-4]
MVTKNQKINNKLQELGKTLGLNEVDTMRAKRTTKNIITMALATGAFILLGNLMMPGGPVGAYYAGVSFKDFQLLFGWFL